MCDRCTKSVRAYHLLYANSRDLCLKGVSCMPIIYYCLYQGLASLARERPRDPIEYLAGYLVRHKREYEPVDRDK